MAIIYQRRNRVLSSVVTSEASLVSTSATTNTQVGGTTIENGGTTSNLSSTANCSTGNRFTFVETRTNAQTITNNTTTNATAAATAITSQSGVTDYDALSSSGGISTTLIQGGTLASFSGATTFSGTFENIFETDAFETTSTIALVVDTTYSSEQTQQRTVGTTNINSELTTTTGSTFVTTVRELTSTTIVQTVQTVDFAEGTDIVPIACGVAFDTLYIAGECEQIEAYKGAGSVIAASELADSSYLAEPTITEILSTETDGNTTITYQFERVETTTFASRMETTLAGIDRAATIIAGVIQNAESSGSTAQAGTTYSISIPESVTDTLDRQKREMGTSYFRQLGQVTLVNTINSNDTLTIQGTPDSSTIQIGGNGYPDIGSPRFTFQRGVYDATKVNGSNQTTTRITQQEDEAVTGNLGDGWAFNAVVAFVPVEGTFTDDLSVHVRDCCATTNL
jgi:hypothetical protein